MKSEVRLREYAKHHYAGIPFFSEQSLCATTRCIKLRAMTLLRCSSCRALVERAPLVAVDRCGNCGGTLLPSSVPEAVIEDDPTRPRRKKKAPPAELMETETRL
jgi:hypothetical protein